MAERGSVGRLGWGDLGTGDLAEAVAAPEGRVITAGSGGVMVWDPALPRIERVLRTEPAWCLSLHEGGERLASVGPEGEGEVWDVRQWTRLAGFETGGSAPQALAWYGDDLVIAWEESVTRHDATSGAERARHGIAGVHEVAGSGGSLVVAGAGGARLFRGSASVQVGPEREATALGFSPNGEHFAVAFGRDLRIFTRDQAAPAANVEFPADVRALHLGDDGVVIAALRKGGWSRWAPGQPPAPFSLRGGFLPGATWYVVHPGFSSDGRLLLVSGYHGRVEVFDLATGERTGACERFGEESSVAQLSERRAALLVTRWDGQNSHHSVQLWDTVEGRPLALLLDEGPPMPLVAVDPRRGRVVVCGEALQIVVYDAESAEPVLEVPLVDEEEDAGGLIVMGIRLDEGGERVFVELEEGEIAVDLATGEITR